MQAVLTFGNKLLGKKRDMALKEDLFLDSSELFKDGDCVLFIFVYEVLRIMPGNE